MNIRAWIARVEQDRVQAHAAGAGLPATARCRARAARGAPARSARRRWCGTGRRPRRRRRPCRGRSATARGARPRLNSQGCGVPSYHWWVPGDAVVGELVADRLPGLAAVVGALDDLPEPAARLRGVEPVRVGRGTLEVVDLPAGKMRTADLPFRSLAVGCENERALARPTSTRTPLIGCSSILRPGIVWPRSGTGNVVAAEGRAHLIAPGLPMSRRRTAVWPAW